MGEDSGIFPDLPWDDQMQWDRLAPQYREAIDLAEAILLPAGPTSEKVSPTFSHDSEVMRPLYMLVSSCRDPGIRRRATRLMQICGRQEGMWNAALTARVAQRLMELEEEGLGEVQVAGDIPSWKRISHLQPVFDERGGKATLTFGLVGRREDVVRPTFVETVVW